MSKYKKTLSGIPLRRQQRGPLRSTLPSAAQMIRAARPELRPERFGPDAGFLKKYLPRAAFYVKEELAKGTWSVYAAEWKPEDNSTVERIDLFADSFGSKESAYEYVFTLQQRLSENPLYCNT